MRKRSIALVIVGFVAIALVFVFMPLFFGTRVLTGDERSAAVSVFGSSVALDDVRVRTGGPLTWFGAGVTIGNVISFPRGRYDGSARSLPWLMHELTHVWQYQHGGLGYIPRSVREQLTEKDAYLVHYEEGKTFMEYDIEEQAVIVSEYFASRTERFAPLMLELRGGAPR